jgi:hypothetical protein
VVEKRIAIVEISNCPTYFQSIKHKEEELKVIYKFMLQIAENVEADEIFFKAKEVTKH